MSRWLRLGWPVLIPGALALAALLVWAGAGGRPSSRTDETWARIEREKVLRVGMDASYPPFENTEGGIYLGYDVDLAQEIGRRLGLRVEFVNVGFDGLYDALKARRCDVLISALPYEPQRGADVLYTGGYFNAGLVIVARAQDERIQGPVDLPGLQVAVEMGSAAHQEALALRDRQGIALAVVTAQSSDEALDLVQAGKADAALADTITARTGLRGRPGLSIHGTPITDESFVVAVRRNSPQLFAAVHGVLKTLRGEGWLERLAGRWL